MCPNEGRVTIGVRYKLIRTFATASDGRPTFRVKPRFLYLTSRHLNVIPMIIASGYHHYLLSRPPNKHRRLRSEIMRAELSLSFRSFLEHLRRLGWNGAINIRKRACI